MKIKNFPAIPIFKHNGAGKESGGRSASLLKPGTSQKTTIPSARAKMREIISQVRKIEISTRHLADGLIAGNYHSIFKGQGIEFSEIRDYNQGDDIRAIDWKVTARYDHPFVKEFIEERDLRVYFAIDFSASGAFGDHVEKRRKAIMLAATLMFSALRNSDNIGMFIFTDRIEKFIPARKGRRHVLKLLSSLVSFQPASPRTDIASSLAYISNIVKRRSILFILSDFFSESIRKPISILKNRHDIIAVRIYDRREIHIPDIGLIELEDEETGEQVLVDTSDPEFRKNYEKVISREEAKLDQSLKSLGVDQVRILTDEPYEIPLRRFFRARQKRMVR